MIHAVKPPILFRECRQCLCRIPEKHYQKYETVKAGYAARCKCGWEGSSNWKKIYSVVYTTEAV